MFGAASEAFSQKNINCSIAESIERFAPVAKAARDAGMRVRGAISCCLGCPYQGEVKPEAVGHVARLMHDIGVHHIGVADTIGVGTPAATQRAMERLAGIGDEVAVATTPRQALANVYASLQLGIRRRTHVSRVSRVPVFERCDRQRSTEDASTCCTSSHCDWRDSKVADAGGHFRTARPATGSVLHGPCIEDPWPHTSIVAEC